MPDAFPTPHAHRPPRFSPRPTSLPRTPRPSQRPPRLENALFLFNKQENAFTKHGKRVY